jgi:hypothetical protein
MAKGPSPTYPSTKATPEFIEWFRKTIATILPQTAEIVKTGEMHTPAYFVYPEDADTMPAIVPIPHFFANTYGKDVAGLLHTEMANDPMVFAVFMINEAWVKVNIKHSDKSQPLAEMMKHGIENDADTQEAIVFNCQRKGMQLLATYLIKRPENELVTPPRIIIDTNAGIIEEDGVAQDPKHVASYGRMMVPPKEDA